MSYARPDRYRNVRANWKISKFDTLYILTSERSGHCLGDVRGFAVEGAGVEVSGIDALYPTRGPE